MKNNCTTLESYQAEIMSSFIVAIYRETLEMQPVSCKRKPGMCWFIYLIGQCSAFPDDTALLQKLAV